jgi:putative DNA primase/helicase
MADREDYREVLTAKIIEQLEAGTAPWQKPWNPAAPGEGAFFLPYNPTTGKAYRGANSLYLSAVAESKGYGDPRWMTYKQAAEQGWQVRKGEKGSLVEYWKFTEERPKLDDQAKPVLDGEGRAVTEIVQLDKPRVFRAVVFNAKQMDGVPDLPKERSFGWNPEDRAEAILNGSGANIFHDQVDRAYYSPGLDQIHMPSKGQFPDAKAYYSTALHELGHWTGHKSRLDRDLAHPFGSEGYAKEELRAELASYFLADRLGIPHDPGQHAAYVKSWVQALRDDKHEIFRAARDAEKITDYMLGLDKERSKEVEREGRGTGSKKQAHEMTLAEFAGKAEAVRLVNHGRQWEVFREGKSFGFSDAKTANLAIRDAHRAEVNNAIYSQSADPPGQRKSMPPAQVLAEYPELRERFPEVLGKQGPEALAGSEGRTYLEVPFKEKEAAKALGARWDKGEKSWYVPPGIGLEAFGKWLPKKWVAPEQGAGHETGWVDVGGRKATAIDYAYTFVSRDPGLEDRRLVVSIDVAFRDGDTRIGALRGLTAETAEQAIGKGNYRNIVMGMAAASGLAVRTEAHPKSANQWVERGTLSGSNVVRHQVVGAELEAGRSGPDAERSVPGETGQGRVVLAVPFKEKEAARALGARWDKEGKVWYAPEGSDLGKLNRWLPQNVVPLDPVAEFKERILAAGLIIQGDPIMDGERHRVPVEGGKRGARDGMYIGHLDGKPAGYIENFKTGHQEKWVSGRQLTPEEAARIGAESQRKAEQKVADLAEQHERLAAVAQQRWQGYTESPPGGENGYLTRKQVGAHGVRFDGEKMVVPLRDVDGKLWSLQYVAPEEGAPKHLLKNAKKEGHMHVLGKIEQGSDILVAEGYATAASLHEATRKPVVMAVDSGNLDAVVGELRGKYPTNRIFIMADDDRENKKNVGLEKALAAAEKHNAGVVIPRFQGGGKDWNDLDVNEGPGAVASQTTSGINRSMSESRQEALKIAESTLGPGFTEAQPGPNSRHTGTVVGVTKHHTVQDVGGRSAMIHITDKLDQKSKTGQNITVQYQNCRGQIAVKEDLHLDKKMEQGH